MAKKRGYKKAKLWKKGGKGLGHKGIYLSDVNGEKVYVLVAIRRDGTLRSHFYERAAMAKRAGWKKA